MLSQRQPEPHGRQSQHQRAELGVHAPGHEFRLQRLQRCLSRAEDLPRPKLRLPDQSRSLRGHVLRSGAALLQRIVRGYENRSAALWRLQQCLCPAQGLRRDRMPLSGESPAMWHDLLPRRPAVQQRDLLRNRTDKLRRSVRRSANQCKPLRPLRTRRDEFHLHFQQRLRPDRRPGLCERVAPMSQQFLGTVPAPVRHGLLSGPLARVHRCDRAQRQRRAGPTLLPRRCAHWLRRRQRVRALSLSRVRQAAACFQGFLIDPAIIPCGEPGRRSPCPGPRPAPP